MDLHEQQLASDYQEKVLRHLARAAARPGANFLEVGSWCGQSSVVLAQIAKECGGRLFCIDWWRGSEGTALAEVAQEQDVFDAFWRRIRAYGLDEIVHPLRGPSEVLTQLLKPESFDFVFLDSDHRYEPTRRDIERLKPLVCPNGILAGHDCEGRIGDFDADFLEAGLNIDCHESVHCGVVRAVGEAFANYSIDHAIWSVRRSDKDWLATDAPMPDVPRRRQPSPPLLATVANFNVVRYGKFVYLIPHGDTRDITDDDQRGRAHYSHASSLQEATRIAESMALAARLEEERRSAQPRLVEEGVQGFNIVLFRGQYLALAQSLGPLDLPQVSAETFARWQRAGQFFHGDTHDQVKRKLGSKHHV